MEFLALSDTVLRTLALEDPQLRRVFHGVYPADQLPRPATPITPSPPGSQQHDGHGDRIDPTRRSCPIGSRD